MHMLCECKDSVEVWREFEGLLRDEANHPPLEKSDVVLGLPGASWAVNFIILTCKHLIFVSHKNKTAPSLEN